MSNATHTPGPWHADRWTDEEAGIYGWSFSAGSYLLPLSDAATHDPRICDANARLIAAAPELLQALESAVSYLEPRLASAPNSKGAALLPSLRAAIAKATGATE